MDELGLPFDSYYLSQERYEALKEAVLSIKCASCDIRFVVRPEDAVPEVQEMPDVYVMDLPRSEEFKGEVGLFDPIFREIMGGTES